jgi:hypothetical protein
METILVFGQAQDLPLPEVGWLMRVQPWAGTRPAPTVVGLVQGG